MDETIHQLRQIARLQRHLVEHPLPDLPGWRLAMYYSVAAEPGGDYYDVQLFPDGRLSLLIADASGHDALAAVVMAIVHTILHVCPMSSGADRRPFCPLHDPRIQPPRSTLGHLNQILVENTLEEQFMTAFMGSLNTHTGDFLFANAGHPTPRLWRRATARIEPLLHEKAGLPLGMVPQHVYEEDAIRVEPGDLLVLYTDGLTEARNPLERELGRDEIDAVISRQAPHGAQAVKAGLLDRLDGFLGGGAPQDDVTILIVERLATG